MNPFSFSGNWCYYRVWHISSRMLPEFVRKIVKNEHFFLSDFPSSTRKALVIVVVILLRIHFLLDIFLTNFIFPNANGSYSIFSLKKKTQALALALHGWSQFNVQQTDCKTIRLNCRRYQIVYVCMSESQIANETIEKNEIQHKKEKERKKHSHTVTPVCVLHKYTSFWWWHQNHNKGKRK